MRRAAQNGGFTLMEMIMVLFVLGIVTAVTFPILGRSIKGNRLRTAGRTVVMAGRYARSMAVLKQKEMTLIFDLGAGKVAVAAADDRSVALVRPLDKVRIEKVLIHERKDDEKAHVEGTCRVLYRNNGTCTPYTVRLSDERGHVLMVDVDTLSSARTEKE